MWSGDSQGIRNVKGEIIAPKMRNMPTNMAVWWDGDLLRELLDRNMIIKYDWENKKFVPLVKFTGTLFNNGTKSNPCLQGDIIGDWREEVLVRSEDNASLRLYVSTIPLQHLYKWSRHVCFRGSPTPANLFVKGQNVSGGWRLHVPFG